MININSYIPIGCILDKYIIKNFNILKLNYKINNEVLRVKIEGQQKSLLKTCS